MKVPLFIAKKVGCCICRVGGRLSETGQITCIRPGAVVICELANVVVDEDVRYAKQDRDDMTLNKSQIDHRMMQRD